MTKEEEVLVEKALSSDNPTQSVSKACRRIIKDRINCWDGVEAAFRNLVFDIIDASTFGCEVKLEETVRMHPVEAPKPNLLKGIIWGSVSAIAIIAYIVANRTGIRYALVFTSIISSFLSGHSIAPGRATSVATKVARLVTVTTAKEIGQQIDKFTALLKPIFEHRQIEHSYKDFLCWLQSQYASTRSQELRDSICNLLDMFDYQLVEYADGMIGSFDVSEASIPEPTTSVPALISRNKRRTILKGHYLLPKK